MRILTIDGIGLVVLEVTPDLALPPSLQIISSLCYIGGDFREEKSLAQVIKSRISSLPELKEVVVPSAPLLDNGEFADVLGREKWAMKRRKFEAEDIFRSGKVIMRLLGDGEAGE